MLDSILELYIFQDAELYYVRTWEGDVVVVNDSYGDVWIVRDLPLKATTELEALICLQLIEEEHLHEKLEHYKDYIKSNKLMAWCHRILG